ncbi:MAG: nitroreductase family deazaflavin-dependent oxidoreductase [Mycobacterium sp.]|nr:nitroreductase family deazaflavin-dependent oxidoreductase [Mycobacterium sp.]MBV9723308.1 nitroreductase family deazaflavin-dependent oxidoreductase [Mycobacterium sp.]
MADRPDVSMNPQIIEEFRANGGKVGGPFKDATLLLLHTTGAKSGKERVNPVMYFRIDDKLAIVGSYAGADVDPAWVHNLRAHPRAHIEIDTQAYDVEARELPSDERDGAFDDVVKTAPGFGEYQTKTNRIIPIFELRRV